MTEESGVRRKLQPGAVVHIERIGCDLLVEGGGEGDVMVEGDSPRLEIHDEGSALTITCDGDCRVRLPESVGQLTIAQVGGDIKVRDIGCAVNIASGSADVAVRDVAGPVEVGAVGADLRMTDVAGPVNVGSVGADAVVRDVAAPVHIGSVGADLEAKRVQGLLQVASIGADATFREIIGPLNIQSVGSDLVIHCVQGGFNVESVGADLVLDCEFAAPAPRWIGSAGSNVLVKIPADVAVRLVVPAGTACELNVPGARVETAGDQDVILVGEPDADAPGITFGHIGGGLQLVSQSKAGFGARFEFEANLPDNLEEIISARITEQLAHIQEHLSSQTERIQRDSERMAARARAKAERAADRARASADRMRDKAQRLADRMRKGPRGKGWVWSWSGEVPPPPPPPGAPRPTRAERPVEPVSEQERLAILRMVENKTITIEEAERLLAALEGRG